MEERVFNIRGIAVDVLTDEWMDEDIVNKTPVIVQKIVKRPGGFTVYMKGPFEDIEWYFSKGLTEIKVMKGKTAPFIRIEHEDGIYWIDVPYNRQVIEFLEEYIEKENAPDGI